MKFKCPLIVVNDLELSRKFYEEILQQEVILDFGENITFSGDFCLQTRDSWADFIDKKADDIRFRPDNFELYFEEEAFDIFVERLSTVSVQYVHGVKEYAWGQRVIRFYDPDFHVIEVGESMKTVVRRFISQGLSVEETAERTQHPIAFVIDCLD